MDDAVTDPVGETKEPKVVSEQDGALDGWRAWATGDAFSRPTVFAPIASSRTFKFFDDALSDNSGIYSPIIIMGEERAGSKKLAEAKRRELVAELNRTGEGVIAKAIQGSIGCLLENGVLHLQYPHSSRHSGHAKIVRDLALRPVLERAARQIGVEILVF